MTKVLLVLLFLLYLPHSDVPLLESGKGDDAAKAGISAVRKSRSSRTTSAGAAAKTSRSMIKLLQDDPEIGGAAILGLQEVDRRKKRSGNNNTVKMIADELGLHYAWAAPPAAKTNRRGRDRRCDFECLSVV